VIDSDPQEICVRATGTTKSGIMVNGMPVLLLDPHWSANAETSRLLARTLSELGPSLAKAFGSMKAGVAGPSATLMAVPQGVNIERPQAGNLP
jgi:hypothetical protein